jgi:hypothetical protein
VANVCNKKGLFTGFVLIEIAAAGACRVFTQLAGAFKLQPAPACGSDKSCMGLVQGRTKQLRI